MVICNDVKTEIQKVNLLYDFIKKSDSEDSILEIIEEFCEEYNFSLEDIGQIISDDKYLKEFVEIDCRKHKYFRNNKKQRNQNLEI